VKYSDQTSKRVDRHKTQTRSTQISVGSTGRIWLILPLVESENSIRPFTSCGGARKHIKIWYDSNIGIILETLENSLTSTGLVSLWSLPVTFKTFSAEIAQIIPKDPSYIPASMTVSCFCKGKNVLVIAILDWHQNTEMNEIKENRLTIWDPINKASLVEFVGSNRPWIFPIWSTHLHDEQR
jgi:hypothetical protein